MRGARVQAEKRVGRATQGLCLMGGAAQAACRATNPPIVVTSDHSREVEVFQRRKLGPGVRHGPRQLVKSEVERRQLGQPGPLWWQRALKLVGSARKGTWI
jgi:hypothetical protein